MGKYRRHRPIKTGKSRTLLVLLLLVGMAMTRPLWGPYFGAADESVDVAGTQKAEIGAERRDEEDGAPQSTTKPDSKTRGIRHWASSVPEEPVHETRDNQKPDDDLQVHLDGQEEQTTQTAGHSDGPDDLPPVYMDLDQQVVQRMLHSELASIIVGFRPAKAALSSACCARVVTFTGANRVALSKPDINEFGNRNWVVTSRQAEALGIRTELVRLELESSFLGGVSGPLHWEVRLRAKADRALAAEQRRHLAARGIAETEASAYVTDVRLTGAHTRPFDVLGIRARNEAIR